MSPVLNVIPCTHSLKHHMIPIKDVRVLCISLKTTLNFNPERLPGSIRTALLPAHHFLIHGRIELGLHFVQLSLLLIQQRLGLPQLCIGHGQAAFLLGQVCLERRGRGSPESHKLYETFMILVRKLWHKSWNFCSECYF